MPPPDRESPDKGEAKLGIVDSIFELNQPNRAMTPDEIVKAIEGIAPAQIENFFINLSTAIKVNLKD